MIRFAESSPDARIVSALLRQLSWTHFLSIIYLEDPLQRDFDSGQMELYLRWLDRHERQQGEGLARKNTCRFARLSTTVSSSALHTRNDVTNSDVNRIFNCAVQRTESTPISR